MGMTISWGLVPHQDIVTLRTTVLQPGKTPEEVRFEGDTHPDTFFVGARTPDGALVASGAFIPQTRKRVIGSLDEWRLRSMAVRPDLQGRGLGRALLTYAKDEIGRRGGRRLWCSARAPAVGFYQREGFTLVGDYYHEGEHSHVDMWIDL